MRRGGRFPDDQAEIVFSDRVVEQLGDLTEAEALGVLEDLVGLCIDPAGKHPLNAPLAGWNTLSVLGGHARAVYKASVVGTSGLLEVLCLGPRSDSAVYDMGVALRDSGLLDASEITDLWDALAVLDVVAEDVGLDGWDYAPPPAPDGMVRAVVAQGLLDEEVARVLSADELQEAMAEGWGPDGPDPRRALIAALERARRRSGGAPEPDPVAVIARRTSPRCGVAMPRAGVACIRRAGHPGPHRAR